MGRREIYIFRHGETDWNRERRFQGHTDIPLNDEGRSQAAALALKLLKVKPQLILSSDLKRAKETAEIVNRSLGLPLSESPELRECRLGEAEGWLRERVIEVYGVASWGRWLSVKEEDLDFGFPNGETKRDQLLRTRNYLEEFVARHPEYTRIALSSHGGSLRRLVHSCVGAPPEPVPLPNCVLYKVLFDTKDHSWHFGGIVD